MPTRSRAARALVEQHGEALADAVDRALRDGEPVAGPLGCAARDGRPAVRAAADREPTGARASAGDVYVRRHAKLMLDAIARDGRLPTSQPSQCRSGASAALTLVALGGEVVVDYALRLQREHPAHGLGGRLRQRRVRVRAVAARARRRRLRGGRRHALLRPPGAVRRDGRGANHAPPLGAADRDEEHVAT